MMANYIEIASKIRELIKKGLIPINSKLSERKLAAQYGIGRSTIAAALRILREEGYVESSPKSGTTVCEGAICNASVWGKLINSGVNVHSGNKNKTAIKYLTKSCKKNITFGFHEEFEPYMPLKKAFASLANKTDIEKDLNRFDEKGLPALRETLSKHLKNYGINASPNNIVIFPGYIEAIYVIASSFLSLGADFYCMEGDMMLEQPTVRSTGANIRKILMDGEGPMIEDLERQISGNRHILYVNPVNSYPSMMTFSDARIDAVMRSCQKYNIPILENDFLRDIWLKPPPLPFKARNSENVIYIGAMVNSYVTGMRSGWAVLPDCVVSRICDVKLQINTASNSGVELVINEMLSKGYYYEFLDNFRKKLPIRTSKINEIIEKYLGQYVRWNPETSYYMVRFELKDNIDTDLILAENPYFMMKGKNHSGDQDIIYTNALGMSLEDFKNLAEICAQSIKKQVGKR